MEMMKAERNILGTRFCRAFPPALAGLASGGSALRGAM